MELKLLKNLVRRAETICSNCTFMELKSDGENAMFVKSDVLIVPLWN